MKYSSYIKVRNGKPYFRMAIPVDVQRIVAPNVPKEICFRLRVDSIGEANRAAAELAQVFTAKFEGLRQRARAARPQPLPLTDDAVTMLKPVVEILTKRLVLLEDDKLRDHDLGQMTQLSTFLAAHHLKPAKTPAQFMEQSRARIDEMVGRMTQGLDTSPANGLAEMIVGTTLGSTNIELDKTSYGSEAMQELLRVTREAVLSAYRDVQVRYHGVAVPTPTESQVDAVIASVDATAVATVSDEEDRSLEVIFQQWKRDHGTNPKTADSFRSTLCQLASFACPNVSTEAVLSTCKASAITERMVLQFTEKLQTEPKRGGQFRATTTISKQLGHLKAIFGFARSKLLLHSGDPTRDIRVEVPKNRPPTRKSFTPDHERRIFTHPLYARRELPSLAKAGGAAAFWIPLLMWKSGIRPNELAQAAASNVCVDKEGPYPIFYIDVNNEDGRTTKTWPSNRKVPIHDDLVALGFVEYWKSIPQDGFLFPELRRDKYGRGGERFSEWFNGIFLRRELEITDRMRVMYSFRHGFIERCRNAGMQPLMLASIIGHTGGNAVTDGYGGPICVGNKHAALMRVPFDYYPIAHW